MTRTAITAAHGNRPVSRRGDSLSTYATNASVPHFLPKAVPAHHNVGKKVSSALDA